jgi:hypothetical protein
MLGATSRAESSDIHKDKHAYAYGGAGWSLVSASYSGTAGVYLSDSVALEARGQYMAFETKGSWSTKVIRSKIFLTKALYTTVGVQLNEDEVAVPNGSFSDTSRGTRENVDFKKASSIGPQAALGVQAYLGPFVFGIEFVSLYSAVYYQMEGVDSESEAKRNIPRMTDSPLNWLVGSPEVSFGIAF